MSDFWYTVRLDGLLENRIHAPFHGRAAGAFLALSVCEIAGSCPGGLAAVALNWCRAHGAMPIPGLRRPDQVDATAAALNWSLSLAEREALDAQAKRPGAPRMPANPFQSA